MEESDLEMLIDAVNNGGQEDYLFLWPLAEGVCQAKYWMRTEASRMPVHLFFIYLDDGTCVGVIQDLGESNIYGFVKEAHRGKVKRIMSDALTRVVFPYFYHELGRKKQVTEYQSDEAERSLAGMGFVLSTTVDGKTVGTLDLEKFKDVKAPKPGKPVLSGSRIDAVRKRYAHACCIIDQASKMLGTLCANDSRIEKAKAALDRQKEDLTDIEGTHLKGDDEAFAVLGFRKDGVYWRLQGLPEPESLCPVPAGSSGNEKVEALVQRASEALAMVNDELFGAEASHDAAEGLCGWLGGTVLQLTGWSINDFAEPVE